jgi:hypothetical protein
MPTYFITAFAPKKWAIRKMDKIRRGSCGREKNKPVEGIA